MLRTLTVTKGVTLLATGLWAQEETPDHRLRAAADVLHDMMAAPDRGVPRDLLEKAQCVIIIPGLKKAAFVFGADYGKGYALCRHQRGWSGPAALTVGGGSFGAQIGVESTDLIMLVMNRHGMERIAADKFTIGADVSAAAGPVGRQTGAHTDISMNAELLTWSRVHGLFAGISLDGTVVKKDGGEDRRVYGREVTNREVLFARVRRPAVARVLIVELDRFPRARG